MSHVTALPCYRSRVTNPPTSATDARSLYLDLLKGTLTGAISEDNDSILGGVRTQGAVTLKRKIANAVGVQANKLGLEIAVKKPYDAAARAQGLDWPVRSESMIGLARMNNIQLAIESVIADGVEGDIIETGVWRGGATIFMRGVLKAYGVTDRKVWVADSFEGLPAPDAARYPADAGDKLFTQTGLAVGLQTVKHNFERYGLLDDQVEFLVGWFKDTLPTAPIEKIAVARLDGDMYESTIDAIAALYPKLQPGGFLLIDDYGSHASQCGAAIHDYRKEHGITEEIVQIDPFGAYWRKSF